MAGLDPAIHAMTATTLRRARQRPPRAAMAATGNVRMGGWQNGLDGRVPRSESVASKPGYDDGVFG